MSVGDASNLSRSVGILTKLAGFDQPGGISKPVGILPIFQVFQILSRYGKTAQIGGSTTSAIMHLGPLARTGMM
jgi:hypothetical protein